MDGVFDVLSDDGYRRLRDGESPRPGDVVIWFANRQPEHIAIVCDVPRRELGFVAAPLVISKWGPGPEYIHRVQDSEWQEAEGYYLEYWTDRA